MKVCRMEPGGVSPEKDGAARQRGFTLIELVIVIAIIGILAAFIVPRGGKVFQDAQIASVGEAVHSLKTAIAQYVVKERQGLPAGLTEDVLIQKGYLDGKASQTIAVGTPGAATFQVVAAGAANCATTGSGCYDLSGDNQVDIYSATVTNVAEVVVTGVSAADALAVSKQIDGPSLSTSSSAADPYGRVTNPGGDPTTLYIYVDSL